MAAGSKAWRYSVLGVSVLVALGFVISGGMKLIGHEMPVKQFTEEFGYPLWFMYLTGALEIAGAVLLLIPQTRFCGGLLLIAIMLGALGTHYRAGDAPWPDMTPAIAMLVLSSFVAWGSCPLCGPSAKPDVAEPGRMS